MISLGDLGRLSSLYIVGKRLKFSFARLFSVSLLATVFILGVFQLLLIISFE